MRLILNALIGIGFSAGVALAAPSPVTVGDYGNAMNEVAARLDGQLSDRQRAGDAAAAQRLALVAAMVRRASAELRAAEQSALTDDVATLPADVKAHIDAAFAATMQAESRAADARGFIDATQKTFNALVAVLPIKHAHPVFYGLMSRDLATPEDGLGADVVVYGDRLIDPLYATSPSVAFNGRDLPANAVAARNDRLDVTLPDDVKEAVHFAPPPCEPRPSFGLRLHDVYAEAHGFWPFVWHTQVDTNADLYVLASPTLYEARVEAHSQVSASASATVDFRRRSDFTVVSCERTGAAQVETALPPGATDVACKAAWAGLTGQAAATAGCVQDGAILRGAGQLTGPAKVCSPDKNCACPATAQGFLEISGSYRIAHDATSEKSVADLPPMTFPAGGLARAALAVPAGEKLSRVRIDVSRRACPKVLDGMDFTLGDGPDAAAISHSGAFRAFYRDGVLSLGASDALGAEIGKAP